MVGCVVRHMPHRHGNPKYLDQIRWGHVSTLHGLPSRRRDSFDTTQNLLPATSAPPLPLWKRFSPVLCMREWIVRPLRYYTTGCLILARPRRLGWNGYIGAVKGSRG